MAKDPAFLFYPGDWLGGTMGMSFEEKGAYLELLVLQWNCHRITKEAANRMVGETLWQKISAKFSKDDKGFFNKRLEEEILKRRKHSEKQRDNANKRWDKNQSHGNATAMPLENVNENVNENESINGNFLVPEMFNRFKKINPIYPGDIKKDYKPLYSIALFLCEQGNLKGQPEKNAEELLPIWDKVSEIIAADNFYKSKSLLTISNHIQEIIQIGRNGKSNSKAATGGNVDTRSAFEKIDRMPDSNRAAR